MSARFNAPPGWPAPPPGWRPTPSWEPSASWPPAPHGWTFWVTDPTDAPVLLRKLVNFQVTDAIVELNPTASAAVGVAGGVAPGTGLVLSAFRKIHGGLWVGGSITVSTRQIVLRANAVNRAVTVGTLDVVVPLDQVTDVHLLPGFVTKIIAIDLGPQCVKARCYGASAAVTLIRQAVAQVGGHPHG